MIRFSDLSIRRKLTLTTVAASGMALLLASVAFMVYDYQTWGATAVRRQWRTFMTARPTLESPEDGTVLNGERHVLELIATGAGLPEGDLGDAFTRGWSTKPAASAAGAVWRGIGLSLVGQVVRRHGGTVEVLQETGTVFEVLLPAREVSP